MTQFVRSASVTNADFDGASVGGFFFDLQNLPLENALVICDAVAVHLPSGSTVDWVAVYLVPPAVTDHGPMLVMQATGTQMTGANGELDLKCCPGIVPRQHEGHDFYRVAVYSDGIVGDAIATLSYRVEYNQK